jgi:LPS export ABC transporter protein LptC
MQKSPRLSSYLSNFIPIISMSVLALFSFALIKQTSNSLTTPTSAAASKLSEQNYYLHRFFTSQFNEDGAVKAYIKGGTALHFDISQQLAVTEFSFYFLSPHFLYHGTANKALTTDSSNETELYDDVSVVRSTVSLRPVATVFQSDSFYIRPQSEKIKPDARIIDQSPQLRMLGRVRIRLDSSK